LGRPPTGLTRGGGWPVLAVVQPALFFLIVSPGCSPDLPQPPAASETLRIALRAEPRGLDPILHTSNLSRIVSAQIYEPLIDFDPQLRPVPRLAVRWEREDGGRAWRFELRPGVRWHGGGEMGPDDVSATLRRVLDPLTPSLDLKPLLAGAGNPQITLPFGIRIPFDPPASDSLLPWWSLSILPGGAGPDPAAADSPPRGSGPYRFASRRAGEWILLERNPDWWGGEPAIRYLLFRIFPEALTAVRALELGEIDIAMLRPADRGRADLAQARFRVHTVETPSVYAVLWNLRSPGGMFADARVRRALTLALDRPALAGRLRRGAARVAATLYPPLWQRGRETVPPLPFDPGEASRLLDEAGWRDGDGDGWRERDGAVFSFPLLYALEDELRRDTALLLQADLARVGVRVRLQRVEPVALVRRLRQHDFIAAVHAWRLDPEPYGYSLLHSSQASGGLNYGGYADPVLDRLLEREAAAADPEARAAAGLEIEKRLRQECPMLFVCFPISLVGVNRRVEGFSLGPLGLLQGTPGPANWSLTMQENIQ